MPDLRKWLTAPVGVIEDHAVHAAPLFPFQRDPCVPMRPLVPCEEPVETEEDRCDQDESEQLMHEACCAHHPGLRTGSHEKRMVHVEPRDSENCERKHHHPVRDAYGPLPDINRHDFRLFNIVSLDTGRHSVLYLDRHCSSAI